MLESTANALVLIAVCCFAIQFSISRIINTIERMQSSSARRIWRSLQGILARIRAQLSELFVDPYTYPRAGRISMYGLVGVSYLFSAYALMTSLVLAAIFCLHGGSQSLWQQLVTVGAMLLLAMFAVIYKNQGNKILKQLREEGSDLV